MGGVPHVQFDRRVLPAEIRVGALQDLLFAHHASPGWWGIRVSLNWRRPDVDVMWGPVSSGRAAHQTLAGRHRHLAGHPRRTPVALETASGAGLERYGVSLRSSVPEEKASAVP